MDYPDALKKIMSVLSEEDAKRLKHLVDELDDEEILSNKYAEFNDELKGLLIKNKISLFAQYDSEDKVHSLKLIVMHDKRILE